MSTLQLSEKHRPRNLSQVIGQSAAVDSLRLMLSRGLSSKGIYLLGPSGQGKDSIAAAVIGELAIDPLSVTNVAGADCNAEFVRQLEDDFHNSSLFSTGEGWKACIVSEAHGMSKQAVQLWLPLLERLPANRIVIFTSNAGLEAYAEFSGALFSRCAVYALDLDLEAAAVHVAKIASDEGLNGQPIEAYRALIASCEGNIRAALQRVEKGEMLKCTRASVSEVKPCGIGSQAAVTSPRVVKSTSLPAPLVGSTTPNTSAPASNDAATVARVNAKFGTAFLPGTKNVRYFALLAEAGTA